MSLSLRVPWTPAVLLQARERAEARPLSTWDQAALWVSLGIGLGALAPGALLLPANSLTVAAVAAGLGALLSGGLMAVAAVAGKRDSMDLDGFLRSRLGPGVGSLASAGLLLRNIAWMAFLFAFMADAATGLVGRPDAGSLRAGIAAGLGVLVLAFASAGPHVLLPLLVKRLLAPVAGIMIVVIAVSSYAEMGIPDLVRRDPIGGWPNVWQGADLVALVALAWLPAVASISRYAAPSSRAATSAFGGFALPLFVMAVIGAVYVPAVAGSESWELLTAVPGVAIALLILLALETDGLVVLSYASGSSDEHGLQGLARMAVATIAAVAIAANFNGADLEYIAFAAGLLFLPPVILHWRIGTTGRTSRPALLTSWASGFLAGAWFFPGTAGPLHDATAAVCGFFRLPFPLTDSIGVFGAVIPAVVLTLLVHALFPIPSKAHSRWH